MTLLCKYFLYRLCSDLGYQSPFSRLYLGQFNAENDCLVLENLTSSGFMKYKEVGAECRTLLSPPANYLNISGQFFISPVFVRQFVGSLSPRAAEHGPASRSVPPVLQCGRPAPLRALPLRCGGKRVQTGVPGEGGAG